MPKDIIREDWTESALELTIRSDVAMGIGLTLFSNNSKHY
jgi:hypothetical protein